MLSSHRHLIIFKCSVRRHPEEGEPSIKEEHRAMLLRIVVNLLVPRETDESSGKTNGRITVSRRAALSYLANLEPTELIPFMRALFGPLVDCFDRVEGKVDFLFSIAAVLLDESMYTL